MPSVRKFVTLPSDLLKAVDNLDSSLSDVLAAALHVYLYQRAVYAGGEPQPTAIQAGVPAVAQEFDMDNMEPDWSDPDYIADHLCMGEPLPADVAYLPAADAELAARGFMYDPVSRMRVGLESKPTRTLEDLQREVDAYWQR